MPSMKRIQYRYTVTGQRSALIDPDGGRFTYSYDSLKRLTQVLNPQAQRTTFAYDNAGRRTVKKLASGSRTSFTYDAANRLTTVAQLKSDASVQAKYEYKYDKAGNRTAMAESGHTTARTTWSYDAAYQLTGEHRTGANAFRNTFTYDNRGNRLLKNLDGTRTTSSYDDANQLRWTQDGSGRTTYTFDADGNQQVVLTPSGQRTTSVWDYENKLTGVLNPSGTRETMAYDPDGKRVKQQTSTDTAKYVWDQENYLQETNASDVTQATYTNEPRTYGNLISQRRSSATHYYVFDALGSTRLLTDSSETVSESLLYDAWGNLVTAAPTLAVPFRWVGELGYLFVPSTADYYVRARNYRPSIGRWSSQDPLGFVDGLNRFAYLMQSPLVRQDPAGLQDPTGGPGDDCFGGNIDLTFYSSSVQPVDGHEAVGNWVEISVNFIPQCACWCCEYRQSLHQTVAAYRKVRPGENTRQNYREIEGYRKSTIGDDGYGRRRNQGTQYSREECYKDCSYYALDFPSIVPDILREDALEWCNESPPPLQIMFRRDTEFTSYIWDRCWESRLSHTMLKWTIKQVVYFDCTSREWGYAPHPITLDGEEQVLHPVENWVDRSPCR